MKPPNESGDHVAAAAAPVCVNRAKTETPDALGALSRYLSRQWSRHFVLFSAFGAEADRHAMRQLAVFCEVVKEVQSWQR
jgi:hypothetical protein